MSKYERVTTESEIARQSLLLKETLEKLSKGSLSESTEKLLERLLSEMERANFVAEQALRASQEAYKELSDKMATGLQAIAEKPVQSFPELPSPPEPIDVERLLSGIVEAIPKPEPVKPVDVVGIVKQVAELSKQEKKTSYTFEIERNHSGVLTSIKAVPDEES